LAFLPEQSKSPSSFTEVNGMCHLTASGVLLICCVWFRCTHTTKSQWSHIDLRQRSFTLTQNLLTWMLFRAEGYRANKRNIFIAA